MSLATDAAADRLKSRAALAQELGPGTRVLPHEEFKAIRFIGSARGHAINRPAALAPTAGPKRVARRFLSRYGPAFGVPQASRDLRATSVRRASKGRSAVRFQQLHEGVPVIGGELVVNLDSDGRMLSAGGEVLPPSSLPMEPRVAPARAERTALAAVSKATTTTADELKASRPKLSVYDSRLLGGPGLDRPTLVWRVEVTAGPLQPVRELVLVDAMGGNVALSFSQIASAKDRRICDANNTTSQVPCTSPVRVEGGPASSVTDVNLAYNYSGHFYDFYFQRFGRDSIDGSGGPLISTVRRPSPDFFWNGEQIVLGTGHAADDAIGHEFTHGVTEHTANLFVYQQSGAINESLSDVFGEFIDLTNGAGTDTATTRWQLFEDTSATFLGNTAGGVERDMQDPTLFRDPDRMKSPLYVPDHDDRDSGGIHSNSGVNNKAAYLMTDGGTFNGRTITGLGIAKVARIYNEVQTNLLTSASDYLDLYNALRQACTNLIGTAGITSANCTQVTNAARAVEMNQDPPNASAPEARVCPGGDTPVNVFFDDLENTASGNWTKINGSGENHWYYPQIPNPFGNTTYATSGTHNIWGSDHDAAANYSIGMARPVTLPENAHLRFNHAYAFDNDLSRTYDGGMVEYKVGTGPWTDARTLFADNGYNGTIANGFGNPLQGRGAFVDQSNGYISSRLDLISLAGKSVRFRFRIGTDSSVADYGWFIDDVHIYKCAATPKPPDTTKPTARAPITSLVQNEQLDTDTSGESVPVRIWWPAGSDNLTQVGNLEYRVEMRFADGPWTEFASWRKARSDSGFLLPATALSDTYQFRVTARDEAGNISQPATGPKIRADVFQENGGAIAYSAGWGARLAQTSAFGGFVRPTTTVNATATLNFSGARSVGVVMPGRSGLGTAEFCVPPLVESPCAIRSLGQGFPRMVVFEPVVELNPAQTYSLRIRNVSGRIELDAIVVVREV